MRPREWRFVPFRPQDKRLVVPAILLACVLALVVNVFYRVNTVVTVAGSSMEPALIVAIWAPVYRIHVFDGSGSGS